jgi:hypothetical protein
MNVPPAVLDEDGELGRRYIAAMQLAGRYSYAGREWVIERVCKIIGGAVTDTTTLGARRTTGAICGWCAKVPRQPSPASGVSSAARWATMR